MLFVCDSRVSHHLPDSNLFDADGRRGAAHHVAGPVVLAVAEAVGRGVVPLLAGGQAGHRLAVAHHPDGTILMQVLSRCFSNNHSILTCWN